MHKDPKITAIRSLATVFVVLFHSVGYYTNAWPFDGTKVNFYDSFDIVLNQITMPIFFFLSAYIYNVKTKNSQYNNKCIFIANKTLRLLLPFALWSIIQLIIFNDSFTVETILTGSLHLWFIIVLYYYFIIFSLAQPVWTNLKPLPSLFLLLVLVALSSFCDIKQDLFCLNKFIHYFPFFFLGVIIPQTEKNRFPINKWVLIGFGISLLIVFSLVIHLDSRISWTIQKIASIITIYGIFNIKFSLPTKGLNIITSLDNNSYGIYIIHHIFIWWAVQISILQNFLDTHVFIAPLFIFTASLSISWMASHILSHNRYTKILMGERNK